MTDDTETAHAEPAPPAEGAAAPRAEGIESLFHRLAGDTLAAKIDALHAETFPGSALAAAGTEVWNLVHGFKEAVKALLADAERLGHHDL